MRSQVQIKKNGDFRDTRMKYSSNKLTPVVLPKLEELLLPHSWEQFFASKRGIRNESETENTSIQNQRKDGRQPLEINVHDEQKQVDIWLTNQEQTDQLAQMKLKAQYRKYTEKHYMVAVFFSGNQNLTEETSALLRYNRRRTAEWEVQREQEAGECR